MLLSMRNICKSFSGIPVLQDVSFDLNPGEVHILAGENGAGKTTLIKILAGVHTDYRGEIEMDGRKVRFASPHDAARQGISVIHQEMSLVGTMPVVDNIFLGREFPNRVFESMDAVVGQLEAGLLRLAGNTKALRSLTAWPWIVSLNMKAN
jgi:ABC-type sugar transport system ATPase subunit